MLRAAIRAATIASGLLRNPIPETRMHSDTSIILRLKNRNLSICHVHKLVLTIIFISLTKNENNHDEIIGPVTAKIRS